MFKVMYKWDDWYEIESNKKSKFNKNVKWNSEPL